MVPDAAPTAVRTTAMFCKPFKATLREAMSAFSGKHSNAYTLPRAPTQCAMSTEKYPWCAPTSATTSPGSAARASHASSARSGLPLYTLLGCFGDAFKLHPWLPRPLVLLLGGVVAAGWAALLAPRIRLERGFFRPFDLLLVAYVLELGVSLLFSGSIDVKNINHLVAYTTVVALYYFFVKFLFAAAGTWAHYE